MISSPDGWRLRHMAITSRWQRRLFPCLHRPIQLFDWLLSRDSFRARATAAFMGGAINALAEYIESDPS